MRPVAAWVPVVVLVTAVAEIVVFVLAVRWLGLLTALPLVLVFSLAGLVLLRREGIRAWRRFRQSLDSGQPPGDRVADALVGLVGALLLAVPGFLTGGCGLLMLVPPGRLLARRMVRRLAEGRMPSSLAGDVFGPRRVRVRRGPGQPADHPPPSAPPQPGPAGGGDGSPPVLEGEIVDPPDQPR